MTDEPALKRLVTSRPLMIGGGAMALALLIWAGYALWGGSKPSSGTSGSEATQNLHRDELLRIAVSNLNRLDQFEGPEMLMQTVDRLDKWIEGQKPPAGWKSDPLLAGLSDRFRRLPVLQDLGTLKFTRDDGTSLQEAIWLRDISRSARGDDAEDLPRACKLFDWTVRNIQLERDVPPGAQGAQRVLQTPWETLLLGRGSAAERAWVFLLLARQQGLDAGLLALPDPKDPANQNVQPWALGVLAEGQVYLFDPSLGLPIPAPDGLKLDAAGPLDIRPASLSQVADDDSLLRQMDADPQHPYRVTAAEAGRVVVLLDGSPAYLSERMKMVESRLSGDERVVLSASPSQEAKRWKACPQVADVRIWPMPYEVIQQRMQFGAAVARTKLIELAPFSMQYGPVTALWRGRVLHMKGALTGPESATYFYQLCRIPERELDRLNVDPEMKAVYLRAKLDAGYWLGLIAAQQGNTRAAVDYLAQRTLKAAPGGPWTHGAAYNLARVYEADKQYGKAIDLYRVDVRSPGRYGNLLRARWLAKLSQPAQSGTPEGETPPAAAPKTPAAR